MQIKNESIKAACIMAQSQKYLHHSRSMMTIDELDRMSALVTKDAAAMYDHWLALEKKRTKTDPDW